MRACLTSEAMLLALLAALVAGCGGSSESTPPMVATVTVSLETSTLVAGQATTATAVLRDASGNLLTGRTVTWTSSSPSVATVSPGGSVVALGVGTASITASSEGQSGSALLVVSLPPVASVAVMVTSPVAIGQTAQATAVVFDGTGKVLDGRPVTWSSSDSSVASVSAAGLVTAGASGKATLVATSEGLQGSAPVRVLALVDFPTRTEAVSALSQTGPPGSPVVQAPAVVVKDARSNPMSDVTVAFVATEGGGTITGGSAITDGTGVARASTWTFGPAGSQAVRASVTSVPSVTTDFSGLSRDPLARFDISLRFLSVMSDSQARAFVHAKERIEEFILGDISGQAVNLSAAELASCGGVRVSQYVDDVLILAEIAPIDGPKNILGQAGPCFVRLTSTLPVLGYMKFDSADIDVLEAQGRLEYVFLHEMMHVIGFGTIWTEKSLLTGAGTEDPYFNGAAARQNLASLNGGSFYTGTPVPVENTGGAGTADSHWRDSVFKSELMTGFISTGVNPISATTIGSFQDLGYSVDVSRAEPFNLSTALRATALSSAEPPLDLGNDVRTERPGTLGPDGRPLFP